MRLVIYKIQNNVDSKIYIGLTSNSIKKRIGEHLSCNYPVGKSLRKYGVEAFTVSVIDSADTIDDIYEKEKYWIAFHNSKNPNGYNLTDGGDGKLGYKPSEETRRKWSDIRKGRLPWNAGLTKEMDGRLCRTMTEEHKDKIRQALLGHIVTEETKAKIRKSTQGKNLGRHFTQEHRDKISKTRMGMIFSDEHKLHLKLARVRMLEKRNADVK